MRKMLTRLKSKNASGAEASPQMDTKAPQGPKRKRVGSIWRSRPFVFGVLAIGLAGLGGAGTWAVKSGLVAETATQAKWSMIKASADMGFTVQDVLVTGRGETDRRQLLDALDIARGAPLLAYDFQAAKTRVEQLPWVQHARMERLMPDTLMVHLIERHPIALWQNNSTFSLIDEEGQIITRENLGRFADMIQVVGEDAPDFVGGLLELLETQPDLKDRVKAAVRVGGRRWDLALEGGVNVRLPEDGAPEALARLAAFEVDSGVLGRDVRVLDLRVPDRVIVRRVPSAPRRPQAKSGQNT